MPFIYETYDTVSQSGFKDFRSDLPDYITKNLKHPLRPYQQEAIGRYLHYKTDTNRAILEQVLYNMATGSGKTFTAITFIYRLLKFAKAKRVLFLVDTKNLGEQAEQEFLNYLP